MKIRELKEKDSFEMEMLLIKCTSGTTNSGSPYLSLLLQDNSGTIEGKVWDVKEATAQNCKTGEVVKIKGQVNLYQNNLQLKVTDVSRIDQSTIDIKEFTIAAPVEVADLKKTIEATVKKIENAIMRKAVEAMIAKYQDKLYDYPAASRNHHDYLGGLAVHIKTMIDLAEKMCEIYPSLNKDLLFSGVLLHDLGKTEELSGPLATEYTTYGRLIGHISIMQSELASYASENGLSDSEEIILLRHMILSHHGELEFGSPIMPLIKEAEVLSFIDNIDARINMIDKALTIVRPGDFGLRNYSLDNRSFYKPSWEK